MDSSIYDFALSYIEQHPEWVTDRISGYEFDIFVMGSIVAVLLTIIIVWLAIMLIARAVHNKKVEESYRKWDDLEDVPSGWWWIIFSSLAGMVIIIMIFSILINNTTIGQLESDPVLYLANEIFKHGMK